MKYLLFISCILLIYSCGQGTDMGASYQQEQDSIKAADDSMAKQQAEAEAKQRVADSLEGAKNDSAFKAECPDLVPYFELSKRYERVFDHMSDSGFVKRFGILNDSIVLLEKNIVDHKMRNMDISCIKRFIDQRKNNMELTLANANALTK